MATSGSSTVTVAKTTSGNVAVQLKLSWSQVSQSIPNNTTTIRLTLQCVTLGAGAMYGTASKKWSISVGGSVKKSGTWTIQQASNTTRTIGTVDVVIAHGATGKGSFSASATARFDMNFNGTVSSKSVSLSGTLNTIPRASTPSVSGTKSLGSTMTITTNRAASSFTHTIKWAWAGKSGTIATGVGASTTWTPAIATFAPYLTTATSGTCTITCDTYNGSTKIGTKNITFSLSIPSSVVPSITSVTPSDSAGYFAIYGAYVQSKSNINVATVAAGIYGSTIKSYSVKLGDKTATGETAAIGIVDLSGSQTISVTVTDTRGRTTTTTTSPITFAAYSMPSLNGTNAIRWNTSTDKEDDESATVRVQCVGSVTDVNGKGTNVGTVKIEYKLATASTWTDFGSQANGLTFNYNKDVPNIASTSRYNFRVTCTDFLGSSTSVEFTIETAHPIIDLKSDGKGIAFMGISDLPGVKIGDNLYLSNDIVYFENSDGTYTPVFQSTGDGAINLMANEFLSNDKYLAGRTNTGGGVRLLGVNADNQVELNWTLGGLKGRVRKEIWSGTWASGTVTIQELPYYNILLLETNSSNGRIIAWRMKNDANGSFTGIGGFNYATSGITLFGYQSYTQSSATVLGREGLVRVTINAASGAMSYVPATDISITSVIGIL